MGYQAVSLIDPETVLQLAGRDISSVTGNGKILADADENGVPIEVKKLLTVVHPQLTVHFSRDVYYNKA